MSYNAEIAAHHAEEGWHMHVKYGGFEERPNVHALRERAAESFGRFFGVDADYVIVEVTEVAE